MKDLRELDATIRSYYTRYYHDQLGLPDWRQKVESRIDEETVYPQRVLDWIERWLNYSFAGKRVLVVGAGTGAELYALQARGAWVTGIEPDDGAVRIIAAKARLRSGGSNRGVRAVGESLPYPERSFDFVYCYTVLEHTREPFQCVDEMLRVVRTDGWVFIETPDYRFPYEGHYKIPWFPLLPKPLGWLYLRFRRRPPAFLSSIRYVTGGAIHRHLQNRPVVTLQVYWPVASEWRRAGTFAHRLQLFFLERLGIQRDLWLLITSR